MNRVALALLLVVAACSINRDAGAHVISTASTIGTGTQRILVEFNDELDGTVVATLRNEDGSPLDETEGEIVWLVPDERAAYAFYLDIPEPETYQLTFEVGSEGFGPLGFVAVDDPVQVTVGDVAPAFPGKVVLLASPTHCPSNTCSSMLEVVDEVTSGDFVTLEVFSDLESAEPVLSEDIEAWGIPGQPWLYVVDAQGVITNVFEGAVSESELEEALDSG